MSDEIAGTRAITQLGLEIPNSAWLTSNQRLHWAAKAKRTAHIRQLSALQARLVGISPMMQVHVAAFIGYPTSAKADPPNAAPSVKAAIDGLTDAGVWPDDDSEHVVAVEFRREAGKAPKGHHTIRLVLTDQALTF